MVWETYQSLQNVTNFNTKHLQIQKKSPLDEENVMVYLAKGFVSRETWVQT